MMIMGYMLFIKYAINRTSNKKEKVMYGIEDTFTNTD